MTVGTQKNASLNYYDVVVIGGGAAGMMAAATAAEKGARTLLLEQNNRLGKKLSITGGGRCNVTNNKPVVRELVSEYKSAGKFLFSTFVQFGVVEMIAWLKARGVPVKEENEGRLFPKTESAETICAALSDELARHGVDVQLNAAVTKIRHDAAAKTFKITKSDKTSIQTAACIIATGGTARPDTGSTGVGFEWLARLGHTIVPNSNMLVPVALDSIWTHALSGLTLSDVKVSVWSETKKEASVRGRILFTHTGLTGPLILNLSEQIGAMLAYSTVTIKLNLFPQFDDKALKEYLQATLETNKKVINALAADAPRQLVKGILDELNIDGETPGHSLRKEDRRRLLTYLAAIPLPVSGLLGADKAVASAGGVELAEVDFRTMESRVVPQLYIVGDTLNINRPSGGYSLQLCWSTGYVAGSASADTVLDQKK